MRSSKEILVERQLLRRWFKGTPGIGWRLGIEMDEQGVTLVTQLAHKHAHSLSRANDWRRLHAERSEQVGGNAQGRLGFVEERTAIRRLIPVLVYSLIHS
jgi:hypothetical protein